MNRRRKPTKKVKILKNPNIMKIDLEKLKVGKLEKSWKNIIFLFYIFKKNNIIIS